MHYPYLSHCFFVPFYIMDTLLLEQIEIGLTVSFIVLYKMIKLIHKEHNAKGGKSKKIFTYIAF